MARDKQKGKRKISQEPEPEDWCFYCKDGGQLFVCDHKNCGKVYHPECVEKDETFFKNVKSWSCGWHVCYHCNKRPEFSCISCPIAACKKCVPTMKFTLVRGVRGLCVDCFELVKIIEQNLEHDSEGKKISFDDVETYEALFKTYWENVIKVKEGLTSDELSAVLPKPNNRKGKNSVLDTSCCESEDDSKSNSYEDSRDKKTPTKRKRYNTVDKHIDDQSRMESKLSGSKKKPVLKKAEAKSKAKLLKPSDFASIHADNIKLIYLKQSLVQELSKEQPRSFVSKVIGTFVRVKVLDSSDPKQRRKFYQLVRVLGVVIDEISHEIRLQVSASPEVIPISELSDGYFTKVECRELQEKVETGLLPKLTVKEVQEKVEILHEGVTRHWISWRLKYLKSAIDHANCKGWTKEKSDMLKERERLEKPEGVKDLLSRVPSVTPEFIEATDEDDSETSS